MIDSTPLTPTSTWVENNIQIHYPRGPGNYNYTMMQKLLNLSIYKKVLPPACTGPGSIPTWRWFFPSQLGLWARWVLPDDGPSRSHSACHTDTTATMKHTTTQSEIYHECVWKNHLENFPKHRFHFSLNKPKIMLFYSLKVTSAYFLMSVYI